MRTVLLTLLAASSTSALAAPPAGTLTLEVERLLIPGTSVDLLVSGASPGQTVYIGVSPTSAPDALCPAILAGLCLDLVAPKVVAKGTADASGTFATTITAPNSPAGQAFTFQAAARGARSAAKTSPTLGRYNPASTTANPTGNGSMSRVLEVAVLYDTSSGAAPDGYWANLFARPDGLDVCGTFANLTGAPATDPCPDCDFSWDVSVASGLDVSEAGDCLALLNLDPSPAFSIRLGVDEDGSAYGGAYGPLAFYSPSGTTWYAIAGASLYPLAPGYNVMYFGQSVPSYAY